MAEPDELGTVDLVDSPEGMNDVGDGLAGLGMLLVVGELVVGDLGAIGVLVVCLRESTPVEASEACTRSISRGILDAV
jgi:hypothetical protein